MKIKLYDGMNYIRILYEGPRAARAPRNVMVEMLNLRPDEFAIWCWDGKGSKGPRLAIYPEYKAKRTAQPTEIWATINLIRDMLRHTRAIQVQVPGFEADDVIAQMTCQYVSEGHTVHIHSNDGDFGQLLQLPGVTFNGKLKAPAEYLRLYKTCVGDPSDNIPGIKGFGQKAWDEFPKKELLETLTAVMAGKQPALDAFKPQTKMWLEENPALLKAFWDIVGFLPVPKELINDNTTIGKENVEYADATLKEFFN